MARISTDDLYRIAHYLNYWGDIGELRAILDAPSDYGMSQVDKNARANGLSLLEDAS